VISSFIVMLLMGFTLNVLTLMALSLSIGILIDDAIVVIENIVRHRSTGRSRDGGQGRDSRDHPRCDGDDLLDRRCLRAGGLHARHIGRFFFAFGITVAWACWCRCSCRSR